VERRLRVRLSLAPGIEMQNSKTNTGPGASEFSRGDRIKDKTVGQSKGASEFSPGDRMNDKRGH
jgi:hypothetical protein